METEEPQPLEEQDPGGGEDAGGDDADGDEGGSEEASD